MLKFLKLISGKKFSLIELPVFLTIYMDTRYSSGCCRTMRGFTENTPFELSLSSVFNAINSLIGKGYVKKKYNEEKDCIYYVVPDVEQEANRKIPDCALETTLSDKIQSVSEKRKEKKKNVFSPPDRQTVQENMKKYFSKRYGSDIPDDFIEQQTEMFFAYYEQIDWEIGKTRKKMKNVALACSGWVLRDNSFDNYRKNTVVQVVQPVSIDEIVRSIYSIYEPMHLPSEIEWKNDKVQNLIEEQARAFYAQMTKKNWQLNTGCNTWQDQLQVFAADMYCPLRVLNPGYVPKNKQEREYYNMLFGSARNTDPITQKGLETIKGIFSILDEKDEEEKAKIEQRKKDIVQ